MQDSRKAEAATTIRRGGNWSGRCFDVAPLLRLAELALVDPFTASRYDLEPSGSEPTYVTGGQIAGLLGVSRSTLYRWRSGAKVDEYEADALACRVGLHPCLLWPQWFDTRSSCDPQGSSLTVDA